MPHESARRANFEATDSSAAIASGVPLKRQQALTKETITKKVPSKASLVSKNDQPLVSRDEMNLAEFPLTVLSTRSNPKIKTLEFSDTIYHRSGRPIHRRWTITGADKFGLPTSSDDEVLLGLLKLTVNSEFNERKIFFTRYELLKILRWSTEGRSYARLQNALDRLSGVRIKATNAFFDNDSKSHSTRNFGILDAYEIYDGRDFEDRKSFFIWSEALFKSFQAGFIKKLDLDFYLGLNSAVSKRLYRYLDKHFWYRSRFSTKLFILCHEKLGISRNYKYPSMLKQQLEPAIEELMESGFLSGAEYQGKGKDTEVVFFVQQARKNARKGEGQAQPTPSAEKDPELYQQVIASITERGLSKAQGSKLLQQSSDGDLQRVVEIVRYYDDLIARGSQMLSKNPVGFLYKAVESPWEFNLPQDFERKKAKEREQRSKDQQLELKTEQDLKKKFQREREEQLCTLRADVEPQMLASIQGEVEESLDRIRGVISAERFEETVQHGIDERLAQMFALVDFEEWREDQQRRIQS